ICECKNNRNPFVFLTRKKNAGDRALVPQEFVFPIRDYNQPIAGKPNSVTLAPAFFHLALDQFHYRFAMERKAVQFAKIVHDKKDGKANHDGLYDALLYPLIKAFQARLKEVFGRDRTPNTIWLFFPIVVTAGQLYEMDTSSPEPLTARLVDHMAV